MSLTFTRCQALPSLLLLAGSVALAAPTNPDGKTYNVVSKQCDGAPLAARGKERISFGNGVMAQIYVHTSTPTEICTQVLGIMPLITSNSTVSDRIIQHGSARKVALRTACREVKDGVAAPNFKSDSVANLAGDQVVYSFTGEGARATVEILGLEAAQMKLAEFAKTAEVEVEEAELISALSFVNPNQADRQGFSECPVGRLRMELALPTPAN